MNINDFDRMLIEYNPEKEYTQVPNPNNRSSIFTEEEKIKLLEISKIRDRGYAEKRQREANKAQL